MSVTPPPKGWKGFRSIKGQLIFSFLIFVLIQASIFTVFFWSESKEAKIREIGDDLKQMNLRVQRASNLEKDFFIEETNNEEFYRSGKSIYVADHKLALDQIKETLEAISQEKELGKMDIEEDVDYVIGQMASFEFIFDSLVSNIKERGGRGRHGLEGEMDKVLDNLSYDAYRLDKKVLQQISSLEKEYILNRDFTYAENLFISLRELEREINDTPLNNDLRIAALEDLKKYQTAFERLLLVDASIGLQGQPGLREALSNLSDEIETTILEIDRKVTARSEKIKERLGWILLVLLIVFVVVNITLGLFLFHSLSTPLQKLATSIHQVVDSNFKNQNIYENGKVEEIDLLSNNFRFMLDKVEERTAEVLEQKEEISTAYNNVKLLREIGQEITTYLSVDRIIEVFFQRIEHFIHADLLMVGIYQPDLKALEFRGVDKADGPIKHFYRSLEDTERIGISCFLKQEIYHSNRMSADLKGRWEGLEPTSEFEDKESVVYLPLSSKTDKIGVITVQAAEADSYSEFQLSLVQGLTVIVTSAMENALMYEQLEEKVKERTVEVVSQKKQIERKNQQLTSSINYARRIQSAILPDMALIRKHFPQSFIFYQPRDIVSGDFYWFHRVDPQPIYQENYGDKSIDRYFKGFTSERFVVAAADCTGHGVPGAFMSMVGHEVLNNVVAQRNITDPAEILKEMHLSITSGLRQAETDNRDGMDISVCTIDLEEGYITFAGAKNPLVFVRHWEGRQPEMEVFKGNTKSVGGKQNKEKSGDVREYTNHTISLTEEGLNNISFYIFSDGYQDQFGGKDNTKFFTRRFRSLLWSISEKPMEEQNHIIQKTFEDWKGSKYRQTDDVLVMGFEVPAIKKK